MPKSFQVQDKYFKQAKAKGYLARSAFKLQEIQARFKILKPSMDVLDLGAAPGSWLQAAAEMVGPKAKLVGIDLAPIKAAGNNITAWQGDVRSSQAEEYIRSIHPGKFSVILSDLAPSTGGIKAVDQHRSMELAERVVDLAGKFLAGDGAVLIKVFQGNDLTDFIRALKDKFKRVDVFKPKSSRDRSFEVYVIGRGFNGQGGGIILQ